MGIDASPKAIEIAKRKATDRGVAARFVVRTRWRWPISTKVRHGARQRPLSRVRRRTAGAYVASLAAVVRPGGRSCSLASAIASLAIGGPAVSGRPNCEMPLLMAGSSNRSNQCGSTPTWSHPWPKRGWRGSQRRYLTERQCEPATILVTDSHEILGAKCPRTPDRARRTGRNRGRSASAVYPRPNDDVLSARRSMPGLISEGWAVLAGNFSTRSGLLNASERRRLCRHRLSILNRPKSRRPARSSYRAQQS